MSKVARNLRSRAAAADMPFEVAGMLMNRDMAPGVPRRLRYELRSVRQGTSHIVGFSSAAYSAFVVDPLAGRLVPDELWAIVEPLVPPCRWHECCLRGSHSP